MTARSGATSQDNGKVTLAVLDTKLDYLTSKIDTFCEKVEPKIEGLVTTQAVQEEKISQLKRESRLWLGANSIGAIIAGILGVNK